MSFISTVYHICPCHRPYPQGTALSARPVGGIPTSILLIALTFIYGLPLIMVTMLQFFMIFFLFVFVLHGFFGD